MKLIILLISILAVLFGAFLVVYGEGDDSPGAQLIGVVLVLGGGFGAYKGFRRPS